MCVCVCVLKIDMASKWIHIDVVGFFGSLLTEILDISRCAARGGLSQHSWLEKTFKNCVSLLVSNNRS